MPQLIYGTVPFFVHVSLNTYASHYGVRIMSANEAGSNADTICSKIVTVSVQFTPNIHVHEKSVQLKSLKNKLTVEPKRDRVHTPNVILYPDKHVRWVGSDRSKV